MMKILLLGSGGREHALAWKLNQSKDLDQLYIAPGNAGTSECGINVKLSHTNFDEILDFCNQNNVEMVICGPEQPLVDGLSDYFKENSPKTLFIGPSKKGAQLEGSKSFSKEFMKKYNIPTAGYKSFTSENKDDAFSFLKTLKAPYVIKADGLAAGKGVVIASTLKEAEDCIEEMFGGQFGDASKTIVIEEFLDGIELSVFALTDGKNYVILPNAKDYKRIGENDTGLNTGGMGTVSPVPFSDDLFMKKIIDQVVEPTINGFQSENIDYCGFVFFGLIKVNNEPFVIEYNVRMGDPETQSVMARLDSDFLKLCKDAANGTLKSGIAQINPQSVATVVLTSGGYPGSYEKGKVITDLNALENQIIFHAGTAIKDNNIITNGGRVIAITSLANDMSGAIKNSMITANNIQFEGKYFRTDIGKDILEL